MGGQGQTRAERSPGEDADAEARKGKGETFGGVDVEGNTRQELMERARKLGIRGVSGMNKQDLGRAIRKKQ